MENKLGDIGEGTREGWREGEKTDTGGGREAGWTGREWVQIYVRERVPPPRVLLCVPLGVTEGLGLCSPSAVSLGSVLFLVFQVFQGPPPGKARRTPVLVLWARGRTAALVWLENSHLSSVVSAQCGSTRGQA